jgi:GTP-binding protein Era
MGVPNAGKSSLVNALVGIKVSIVSPKPQTTRQRVMGIGLLAPRPGAPPNTQAVFLDTAGVMELAEGNVASEDVHSRQAVYRKKALFKKNKLHKAMVNTAWKAAQQGDALLWVLDASRCCMYGDYLPEAPMLDGIPVGPPTKDAWWLHPEMREELGFLRRIRNRAFRKVHVVLNKIDLLSELEVEPNEFVLSMKERLSKDLGENSEGEPLLGCFWPTSVAYDPDSLGPIKSWLCENLPMQSPVYPPSAVSDVPARVAASEITREKLFGYGDYRGELPYDTTVVNAIWRESEDGTLKLGQKVVVKKKYQANILKRCLREIAPAAEDEISETVNFGRPVELHFHISVDPNWMDKQEYYDDVQGLLSQQSSLQAPRAS